MKPCRSGISFRMTRKGDYIQEQIVTGQICPYCGRNTVLVDSVAVKDTIVNTADTLKDSVVNKAIVDTLQNNLE